MKAVPTFKIFFLSPKNTKADNTKSKTAIAQGLIESTNAEEVINQKVGALGVKQSVVWTVQVSAALTIVGAEKTTKPSSRIPRAQINLRERISRNFTTGK
jgi:hypothetical protein